jgi:hypothetical protein
VSSFDLHPELSSYGPEIGDRPARSLMISRRHYKMRLKSILLAAITTASLAAFTSTSAQASTVGFTFNLNGGLTAPPVFIGTGLILDGLATGSFTTGNPHLDSLSNPASLHTHDTLDFATAQSSGVFTFTFADGSTFTGSFAEDDSAVIATNSGPFTEMLTITGGTGKFAGATGFASGGGIVGATGYTSSGRGTVTAAGLAPVPEPASVALVFEGVLGVAAGRKLLMKRRQS